MLTQEQKLTLTVDILRKGKAMVPDRFPAPSPETAAAWASALDDLFDLFPMDIWPEVVDVWARELVDDRMVTPKSFQEALFRTRDKWMSDRVRRPQLEKWREFRLEARMRMIEGGGRG